MKAFAELLDRLYFTSGNLAKAALLKDYLSKTPDPDRGWAIAAIAGTLSFDFFKRNLIKQLITERVDPYLFDLCTDYVGETSETVAHLWPISDQPTILPSLPSLSELVESFQSASRPQVREQLIVLLDNMTPSQRWALIKLGTRGLRVGMSARFVKKVLAVYGKVDVTEIETLWHGLKPPYVELLQWLDGNADKPDVSDKIVFHPVMLAHPIDDIALAEITPDNWRAEWKYDGIRVQLVGKRGQTALFSRTGDDITHSFPDVVDQLACDGVFDGELLVTNQGEIASFNDLQQRLNKSKPTKKLMEQFPGILVLYDAIKIGKQSLLELPLSQRAEMLAEWLQANPDNRLRLSRPLDFTDLSSLHELKSHAADQDKDFIEGLMLKNKHSSYVPGRPKGQWYKWKRDPKLVDAVIMYAQRGHGKRSSFYSDFTFGLWQDERLLPIGKAYSGFTDDELKQLDKWVRNNTIGRFGPVKEVKKELVLEVAFDAAHLSKRHKSGVALRFPRINRIRWDKPAAEADFLDSLKKTIPFKSD